MNNSIGTLIATHQMDKVRKYLSTVHAITLTQEQLGSAVMPVNVRNKGKERKGRDEGARECRMGPIQSRVYDTLTFVIIT